MGWEDHLPDYLISRVAEHCHRRAVEMRQVAQTLEQVGIEPVMSLAVAQRQQRLVDEMAKRRVGFDSARRFSWRSLSDALVDPRGRSGSGK